MGCVFQVNASIEAFSKSRSLCTLFELGESLEDFVLDKGKFETLKLGPLQCLPEVYRMFKFPQDENIPEITSADVLEVCTLKKSLSVQQDLKCT